jgi:hypothetical protein
MKISFIALGVLLVGVAFAMSDVYVSGTWRYKMTVEVETPEGIKTGSAIHEISNSSSSVKILALPESGNPAKFRGEAVVIDMGKDKPPLFAALSSNPERIFYNTFPPPKGGATTLGGIKYYKNLKVGEKRTIDSKDYPQFISFKSRNDPKTIRTFGASELEGIYGEKYAIKNIHIEISNAPISFGLIDKYLPIKRPISGFQRFREGERK